MGKMLKLNILRNKQIRNVDFPLFPFDILVKIFTYRGPLQFVNHFPAIHLISATSLNGRVLLLS